MEQNQTGKTGERVAAKYYLKQGYTLIEHNYHSRYGEIDLILMSPGEEIVFCEVKTRAQDSMTNPAENVNRGKQRKLVKTAQIFLQQTQSSDALCRFDVAEVTPLDSGRWMVHIIKGAFTE